MISEVLGTVGPALPDGEHADPANMVTESGRPQQPRDSPARIYDN
jgi:hypothetical protein